MKIEICVDSLESALAAQAGGADGVEFCANLAEEGTTPSAGTIALARQYLRNNLNVMIRPSGGGFFVSETGFEIMLRDISVARDLGADGVVFGILTAEGRVDSGRVRELVHKAKPMLTTFHRAIDMVPDRIEALDALINAGVDRVLTSGGAPAAADGWREIRAMVERAAGRIRVAAGGGLTPENILLVVGRTGVSEVHLGSAVTVPERPVGGILRTGGRSVSAVLVEGIVRRLRDPLPSA